MGRHSAPDDADDEVQQAAVALRERDTVVAEPASRGRHSRPEDAATPAPAVRPAPAPPVRPAPVPSTAPPASPAPIASAAPPAAVAPPPVAQRPAPVTPPVEPAQGHAVLRGAAHNSAADLHLVRSHRGVLAMCAVAVLAPFVVEVLVLLVLGTLTGRSVLVWLWAPLVAAGILLGVVLDLAHRRHAVEPAGSGISPG